MRTIHTCSVRSVFRINVVEAIGVEVVGWA